MSGLLVKDLCLLAKRKKILGLYFAIGIMLGVVSKSMFIVAYLTLLVSLLAVSTISYDEFDNGYSFMMALPISPKTYAIEKHVFVYAVLTITWCVSVCAQVIVNTIQNIPTSISEQLAGDVIGLLIYFIMISIILPVDLKYGTEKGRNVLFIMAGLIILLAAFGEKMFSGFSMNTDQLAQTIMGLPLWVFFIALVVIVIAAVAISMACSIRVMQNKEF